MSDTPDRTGMTLHQEASSGYGDTGYIWVDQQGNRHPLVREELPMAREKFPSSRRPGLADK